MTKPAVRPDDTVWRIGKSGPMRRIVVRSAGGSDVWIKATRFSRYEHIVQPKTYSPIAPPAGRKFNVAPTRQRN